MEDLNQTTDITFVKRDDPCGEEVKEMFDFKRRLVHTSAYYFGFFVFGWTVGQRGAVFLDLLLVTGSELTLGSILFTLAGLASIAGGLAGGFLLDATGQPLLMMVATFLLNAVLNSTLAKCKPLPLMSVLYFMSHFTFSVYDVVVNPQLANMWPGSNSNGILQGLHACFAVGAFLSPLATQPFLAPRPEGSYRMPIKSLILGPEGDQSHEAEEKPFDTTPSASSYPFSSSYSNVTGVSSQNTHVATTNVFYALLITGILCLISALMLTLLILFYPAKKCQRLKTLSENDKVPSKTRKVYCAAVIMLGVYNFFGSSVEDVFPHYLMTFVVRKLDWSKASGARITSVYWLGLTFGRLAGVGLARILSPTKTIIGCLTSMIAALLFMLLMAMLRIDWAVWVSAAVVGLSVSALFPAGLVYAHIRVSRLTGRLSSLIFTTPMMAAMIDPILLAVLMSRYDDMWYIYLFLQQSIVAFFCFFLLHWLTNSLAQGRASQEECVDVELEENSEREITSLFLQKTPEEVNCDRCDRPCHKERPCEIRQTEIVGTHC